MKEGHKKIKRYIALFLVLALILSSITAVSGSENHRFGLTVDQNGIFATGDPIHVNAANKQGESDVWVGIYKEGQTPGNVDSLAWYYVTGSYDGDSGSDDFNNVWIDIRKWHGGSDSSSLNASDFPGAAAGSGNYNNYKVIEFEDGGYDKQVFSQNVYIRDHTFKTNKTSYQCNEKITVTLDYPGRYKNSDGVALAWVGLYEDDATPGTDGSLYYYDIKDKHTENVISDGYINLLDLKGRLTGGSYKLKMFYDGGYWEKDNIDITINHNFGVWQQHTAPTCSAKGEERRYCTNSDCGYYQSRDIDIKADAHSWNTGVINPKPTCTTTGTKTYTCKHNASHTTSETVPELGHLELTNVPLQKATCTANGTKEHWECGRCKAKFQDQAGTTPASQSWLVIPKTGHNLKYAEANNVITQTCGNNCGHQATAAISLEESYIYTGSAITPLKLTYGTNWLDGNLNVSYDDNVNVGTAKVQISKNNQNITRKTFKIVAAELVGITAKGWKGDYDGNPHSITLEGVPGDADVYYTADAGVAYDADQPFFTDAGTYTVYYKVEQQNFFAAGSAQVIIRKVTNAWNQEPAIAGWTYGKEANAPTYEAKYGNPTAKVEYRPADGTDNDYTTTVPTEAGDYLVRVSVEETGNYTGLSKTAEFTIAKADRESPLISGLSESIDGKNDGKISSVDNTMEYRKDGENTYRPITGTELTDLEDGIYYVRYKETDNYNPSPDTQMTISAGKKLKVIVPEDQVGYTLTADDKELSWNGDTEIQFALLDGYAKGDDFAVKINGQPVSLDADDTYQIVDAQEDQVVTVEGIVDNVAPAAVIKLNSNSWDTYNAVDDVLYFKDAQSVTITADDRGSGLKNLSYYLAEEELSEDDLSALPEEEWNLYLGAVMINPEAEYIVYARAVDNDGNVTYVNSDEIVVDSIPPEISFDPNETFYGDTTFKVKDAHLDKVFLDGKEITLTDGKYTIPADDKEHQIYATDKCGNVSDTVKVTIKDIDSLDDDIEDITTDDVKSSDKEEIQDVLDQVEDLIDDPKDYTDEEDDKLDEIKKNTEELLDKIEEVQKELEDIQDGIDDYDEDTVKCTDKEDIEELIDRADDLLGTDNLTPDEREDLEKAKDKAEELLDKIETKDPAHHFPGDKETCTEPQKCTECEKELVPAKKHDYKGEVTKEPTCTEDGEMTYTCQRPECGDKYTERIPELGHDTEIVPAVKPECEKDGNIEHHHCKDCDKNFEDPEGKKELPSVLDPKLGHDYKGEVTKEPTCTEEGEMTYTCQRPECGHQYTEKIPALGHDMETVPAVKPECEKDGSIEHHHCKDCGKNFEDPEGKKELPSITDPKLGHDYKGEVTKEPTCTEEGEMTYTCQRPGCGHQYTEKIPALGHNLVFVEGKEPTYTEEGIIDHYYCEDCGRYFEDPEATIEIFDITIPMLERDEEPEEPEEEIIDEPKEEPKKEEKDPDIPDTGDETNLLMWLAMLLVSGGTLFTVKQKRQGKTTK